MITYNTKEEAKAVLRNKELPFGASIILNTKDGDLLGVQGKSKIKFLDMNTLPPTNGKSNQVLKLDESGNVVWAADDMRDIVDDLISTDTDKALSANMGRELNSLKLDNSLIANINILTGSKIVTSTGALQIQHTYRTYSKSTNTFPRYTQVFTIPEANADCNGLLSILKWKMLDYAEQYFNTNTVGFVTAMRDFTYTADQVNLSKKVFYRNNDTWTQTDSPIKITAATQSQAGVMSAADKTKLDNTVSATTEATPDTLGLVKQAAELTDLEADNDLAGVIAHFNQLLANLKEAGIMYATPAET